MNDLKLDVFEVAFLTDEQIERFTSDFRIVADYFVQMRRDRDYVPSRQVVEHVDSVARSRQKRSCLIAIASTARQLMKQLSDQHSSLRFAGCLLMCRVST